MKFKIFLIIANIILLYFVVVDGVALIIETKILETTYYYDNTFDANISGCNFTCIVKIKYDLDDGAIDSLFSINSNSPIYSERLYSFDQIGIFKLIGYLKITGNFTSGLNGLSLNGTDMGELSGLISYNCHLPPTEKDLKIEITDKPIPIIRRNNQLNLFQVAINISKLEHKLEMKFLINDLNSPFSLEHQQITNQIFILKFKLVNPLTTQNYNFNKPIEIIPQNYFGLENSQYPLNYSSFIVKPLISQSNGINQFSNINFYSNKNEIYSYVLFGVKNDGINIDNSLIVPSLSSINDNDGKEIKISIPYPIQGNSTYSKFISSIKPIGNSILYLSSTFNNVSTTFTSKIRYTNLTYSTTNALEIQNYCILAPFLWTTKDYLPTDYSIETMDGSKQNYIEYWGVLSFISNDLQLSFGHSILFSNLFNNERVTTEIEFYNDPTTNKRIGYAGITSGSLNQSPIVSDMLLTQIKSSSKFYYGGWIIKFTVIQTLPFYYLKINNLKVTAINLVGQSSLTGDSLFEIHVDNNFIRDISINPFTIIICDIAFNCYKTVYSPMELFEFNPFPSLVFPIIEFKSIYNINSLFFKNNQINTTDIKGNSNKPIENTIYIGTKDGIYSSGDDGIYLILNNSNSIILNKKLQFNWNSTIGLFYCNFIIPLNHYNGIFDYSIQYNSIIYDYSGIFTILGDNSTLLVNSIQADMLPPLIESIEPMPKNKVLILNNKSTSNIFGWDVYIMEGINGFEYGEFNITSELDKHGFNIIKNSMDLIKGNKLSIRINLNDYGSIKDCINQNYSISSVYLIDKQGYHTSRSNKDEISALFMVSSQDNSITIDCTNSNTLSSIDTTLPYLSEYIVDLDYKDIDFSKPEKHFFKFNFSITDNESGLSSRHDPIVYFEDSLGNLLSISIKTGLNLIESNGFTSSYQCIALFPFGFGFSLGVSISIYGLVDNYMNVKGYDPVSLNYRIQELIPNSTFIPFVNVLYSSSSPFISDIIPKYDNTLKNAQFIVSGYLFGTDLSKVEVIVNNINTNEKEEILEELINKSILNATNPLPFSISSFSGNEVVVDVQISQATTPFIQIQFIIDYKSSNTYNFMIESNAEPNSNSSNSNIGDNVSPHVLTSSSNSTTISTLPTSSKSLPKVNIKVDPISPSASLNHMDNYEISSLINIHEIREINTITNKTIQKYSLIGNWVPIKTNITNQYDYFTILPNLQSSIIYAKINIFDNESTFSFINKIYKVNEKSIKFTLNITNYQIESKLNNIQLIMQAQLNSTQTHDICTKKDCSIDIDNSDILSIQINDKSLYCRFLKNALVDGEFIVNNLTHVNLNQEYSSLVKSNSGQFYYGIVLPSFKNHVIIDPDFSLLLEPTSINSDNIGSICSKSNNDIKLSIGEIVGIVVGGAAFIIIIIIIITYLIFKKHRFSSFTMSIRQWSFKRRLKKSNSNLNLKNILNNK